MTKDYANLINNRAFALLAITLLSIVLYGNTIGHGFSLDDGYISDNTNKIVELFDAGEHSFDRVDYRPISITSFAFQKRLEGEIKPLTSHIINLVLYILGVFAFYRLLLNFFQDDKNKYLIALSVALLFVAHPIHSNVVSSIKSRDILFSFLFAVLGFTSFIKYFRTNKKRYLIPCVLFSLLAILSKLDAIWVLMIIPIYFFVNNGQLNLKVVIKTLLFCFLSYVVFHFRFDLAEDVSDMKVDFNPITFTENPMVGTGIKGVIFYSMLSYFYYIKFFFIPFGYFFYFGYQTIPDIHFLHPYFIIGSLLSLLTLYWLVYSYRKNNFIFLQIMFLLTALFFFVNIMRPVAEVVSPRFAYQASAPFCMLMVWGLYSIAKSNFVTDLLISYTGLKTIPQRTLLLTSIVILFYAPFTISRNADWKNMITLMDADAPNLIHSFQANRIASATYLRYVENPDNFDSKEARMEMAKKGLVTSKNAVKIDPNHIFTQEGIGIAERILGNNDRALNQFRTVIEKFDTSEVAWDFSGDIYLEKDNFEGALFCYKNAIRVNPMNPETYSKLNKVSPIPEVINATISFYEQVAEKYPNIYLPYENLGLLYLQQKDSLTAALQFKLCFERGKKEEHYFLLLSDFLERNKYESQLEVFRLTYQNN